MKELTGVDLWDLHAQGHWVVILTNGIVKSDGTLVMGAGVARQAAERFTFLPIYLGKYVNQYGNRPFCIGIQHLLTLPTKYDYRQPSSLDILRQTVPLLVETVNRHGIKGPIYLPRPGCGLGGLDWTVVRHLIEPMLDDRFVVITNGRA